MEINFRASDNSVWLVTHLMLMAANPPYWRATGFRKAKGTNDLVDPSSMVNGHGATIEEAVLEVRKEADEKQRGGG